jgi:hypothetical protein
MVLGRDPAIGRYLEYTGQIVRKDDTIVFVVGEKEYLPKILGGNPYKDDELETLVGETVTCIGYVVKSLFLVYSYKKVVA